jgi:hypothetical protein
MPIFSMSAFGDTPNFYKRSMISWKMMVFSFSRSQAFVQHGNMRTSSGRIPVTTFQSSVKMPIRGLFMNKYVFPGADASCSLGWVIGKVGFGLVQHLILSLTLLHPHSSNLLVLRSRTLMCSVSITRLRSIAGTRIGSATKRRLLQNMVTDGTGCGFSSLRTAPSPAGPLNIILLINCDAELHRFRQGGASVFQITLHKNLNAYHRVKGVKNHASIHVRLDKEPILIE